jgi:hypothetical protein
MQISTTNDALQEAIRIISRLAPPVSGNVAVQSNGKRVHMVSNSETSSCSVTLPGDVEGKANVFAVAMQSLRDATKGRKDLKIAYDKTLCKITSGAYKCELPTVDAMQLEDDQDKKEKAIKIDAEQASWLRTTVSAVALKPTTLIATFMPLSVKLTNKGAFVACYDSNHMAFIHSNEITGSMEVKLPLDMFQAVLDAFKGEFTIELSKSNLYVSNKLVKVALSLPQEEENELKLEEVISAVKDIKGSKGTEVEVKKEDIIAFMDNARAVATKERSEVSLTVADGKMSLAVQTSNGSTKALIKTTKSKKIKVMIDFEFLDEAIRKSGDVVQMKIVDDQFIAFHLKVGTVIVSLNQETSEEE